MELKEYKSLAGESSENGQISQFSNLISFISLHGKNFKTLILSMVEMRTYAMCYVLPDRVGRHADRVIRCFTGRSSRFGM